MPDTFIAWCLFAFFAGGAAGGWVLLILWAIDQYRAWRKA